MSVINQMLNGLEQRGVQTAVDEVRPVPAVREKRLVKIALGVALLASGVAFVSFNHGAFKQQKAADKKFVTASPNAKVLKQLPVIEPVAAPAYKPMHPDLEPDMPRLMLAEELTHQTNTPPLNLARPQPEPPTIKPEAHASSIHPENTHAPEAASLNEHTAEHVEVPLPVKQVSVAQLADAEFDKASVLLGQGKSAEAQAGFESALRLNAGNEGARRALVALLLQGRHESEAEQVLQSGLKTSPENTGFAMLLARLQIQRNDLEMAIVTLETTLPYALQQADYQAFYAALLQRKNRHQESLAHYQVALKISPNNGAWLMGYGISLQALSHNSEAKEAYQRALNSKKLSPELQDFVKQKMKAF